MQPLVPSIGRTISIRLKRCSAGIVVLVLLLSVGTGRAQRDPSDPQGILPDVPQVFSSGGQRFRVVPMKGLVQPWALAFLPNGDMLITERAGRLRIVRSGVLDAQPIAGIPPVRDSLLKGLMDIALHPRFAENRLVYFTYSKPMPTDDKAATATLARARFDGGQTLTEVRDIFVADAWAQGAQAARIIFGPDGKIYMTVGMPTRHEIGKADDAQNPATHAGKVLRLNDDGTVPADNPFVGRSSHRPEIYALGIRNALGLAFHPRTGELWETENGPQGGDEINIIRAGRNYGWPVVSYGRDYSGAATLGLSGPQQVEPCAPNMEQPFVFWVPAIAVSGMVLYEGDKFQAWKGNILVGAMRGAQLQRVILNNRGLPTGRVPMLTELKQRIREVRLGPDGLLYLLTAEDSGALLRIEPYDNAPNR